MNAWFELEPFDKADLSSERSHDLFAARGSAASGHFSAPIKWTHLSRRYSQHAQIFLDAYKNNFRIKPQRCKETRKNRIYSLLQKHDNTSVLLLLQTRHDSSHSPEIHQKGTRLKYCKSVKGPRKTKVQHLKGIVFTKKSSQLVSSIGWKLRLLIDSWFMIRYGQRFQVILNKGTA